MQEFSILTMAQLDPPLWLPLPLTLTQKKQNIDPW
jgi:hypothetical protein